MYDGWNSKKDSILSFKKNQIKILLMLHWNVVALERLNLYSLWDDSQPYMHSLWVHGAGTLDPAHTTNKAVGQECVQWALKNGPAASPEV